MSSQIQTKVDRLIVGCGYLGLRVARRWLEQGLNVVVTTRSQDKAARFQKLGLQPIVCDVLDVASLRQLPESEIVLHAVAVDRASGQSMRSVYLEGLQNLLTIFEGRCHRYFYVSSTGVYGQVAGEEVTEQSVCKPTRENGQICLEAENLVRAAKIDSLIFRLAGIYGPDRLIARINQRKEALPVPGNPDAWLNLVHVADCVAAIVAGSEADLRNETFLVSDDQPIRRREYYSLLAELLQAPPPVFSSELKDPKGERGAGKRCNNSKLHKTLLQGLQYPTIIQGLPDAISG
ncbi:MAG: SDR family oxidoreductase [Planctomycetaceae bacterium]|nr:SDR family oxidoreductase [Planctomycetaceae bacterium]